jgi:hypothetical protein
MARTAERAGCHFTAVQWCRRIAIGIPRLRSMVTDEGDFALLRRHLGHVPWRWCQNETPHG